MAEFKKDVNERISELIGDRGLMEDFQDELKAKKKAMRNKSKHKLEETFVTTIEEEPATFRSANGNSKVDPEKQL